MNNGTTGLDAALAAECEAVMKRSSASFYEAFRLLSSPRREAVFVLYAFCRMIDDSVDEPDTSPYTLDELEERFERLESAEGHFIWPALRWLLASFPIGKEPFRTQMGGQRMDQVRTHYRSMEELEDYCYRVAGSVGEMLLPVLHERPGAAITEAGVWLGKGMQIVNIMRDVGEDQRLGRRYVPLELMERCGYSEEQFERGVVNEAFLRVLEELASVAAEWFRRGLEGIHTYPADSAFSIRLAAAYYGEIVEAVRAIGGEVFTRRAYVDDEGRKRLLRAVLQGMAAAETARGGERSPEVEAGRGAGGLDGDEAEPSRVAL
ncbi:phytoene/squalene synthase family protein [Paenibacillus sp. FSL W8-1187]|uniref:phytoene/squalene synthase family protein n=1 Tax=unclassified Paenibacillus TaxID=185978 RepID=UPI00129BB1C1|nr:phytoene/squalene synthase family protein [Paenibacillus sp. B01]QGG58269.1 hypothetical protein GE073_23620 [Paenibacillus sp. B01]